MLAHGSRHSGMDQLVSCQSIAALAGHILGIAVSRNGRSRLRGLHRGSVRSFLLEHTHKHNAYHHHRQQNHYADEQHHFQRHHYRLFFLLGFFHGRAARGAFLFQLLQLFAALITFHSFPLSPPLGVTE